MGLSLLGRVCGEMLSLCGAPRGGCARHRMTPLSGVCWKQFMMLLEEVLVCGGVSFHPPLHVPGRRREMKVELLCWRTTNSTGSNMHIHDSQNQWISSYFYPFSIICECVRSSSSSSSTQTQSATQNNALRPSPDQPVSPFVV